MVRLNRTGSPSTYDGDLDEAFVEFDLKLGLLASSVRFVSTSHDSTAGGPTPGDSFDIYVYSGNGAVNKTDWGSGTYVSTQQNTTQFGGTEHSLDVTSLVDDLRAASATHIGFRLTNVTPNDQLDLVSPTLVVAGAGVVGLWAGPLASIPSGWQRADSVGERFVLELRATEEPGISGGSATHVHEVAPPVVSSGLSGLGQLAALVAGLEVADNHRHQIIIQPFDSNASAELLPPYRGPSHITRDTLDLVPEGFIAMWSAPARRFPRVGARAMGRGVGPT